MDTNEVPTSVEGGFGRVDFDVLQRLGDDQPLEAAGQARCDALWNKAERLVAALGAGLFGAGGFTAALWPDGEDDERGPFLWARLKRAGNEPFSTHVGVFLSTGFCNLSIDLEKDPLDAGESTETLAQVLDFWRNEAAGLIDPPPRPDLQVWTDTKNVVPATGFAGVDFDELMAANRDQGHPWPKLGYLLSVDDVIRYGDAWVAEYRARASVLVPIYDAMIRSFSA